MRSVGVAAVLWFSTAVAAEDGPAADVETILEQVERRGASVQDIQCAVTFREVDRITDDVTRRFGTIRFKRKEPNPIFLITFDKTVQDGQVSRKKLWYRFDGRYLYEALERSESIIKRDYAPPGTQIDLFSMESAPFPIPFGQKKDEILRHFDVVMGPGGEDAPPNTQHLVCTPKPTSRFAKEHSKVQFYVSRTLNLPVRIVLTSNPPDHPDKEMTADFPDLSEASINKGLPDGRFELPKQTDRYAVAEE